MQELASLQSALADYFDRFDEYPSTGGGVQTMCAYIELDVGCEVKKVLDDDEEGLLWDPLGEPLKNGYWYASDGKTYTIWALREGPENAADPVCTGQVPPHLQGQSSLFCVSGP